LLAWEAWGVGARFEEEVYDYDYGLRDDVLSGRYIMVGSKALHADFAFCFWVAGG
jgi:hypothetical protein